MRAVLVLALLLLAGCAKPADEPTPVPVESTAPAPPPKHLVTIRVSAETPDGPGLGGAEVEVYPLDAAGNPGAGVGRTASRDGTVRLSFAEPTRIAVRASSPGWTREAGVVDVGPSVSSGDLLVSDRDVFLPLYRPTLSFADGLSLSTAFIVPDNGSFRTPLATVTLRFADGLQAAYLARLSSAEVTLRWEDTATSRADLAAGLAWGGALWTQGEASGFGLGPREATFDGPLPDDRPGDLENARFQAAAVLHTASVGDVPIAFEVTLGFSDREPAGLPKPCHSTAACFPLPLPP